MALAGQWATTHVAGEVLSAYFDGELPVEDRRHVEAHLRGCAACRAALREYHGTSALLHTLAAQPVPEKLGRDLRRRLPTAAKAVPYRGQTAA
jgi:anti-sigma factor RsiW